MESNPPVFVQSALFDFSERLPDEDNCFHQLLSSLNVTVAPGWPDRFGVAMRQWLRERYDPIRILSLFSGGGGLDIGFHDAGFQVVEMVELEPRYAQTLIANAKPGGYLDEATVTCTDIRSYHPRPDLAIDFIIGGPPCQTFSAAGRRAAGVAGISDPRGVLFKEYIRLLKLLQPRGFLFENVYGITGAQDGEAWAKIQAGFRSAGYTIFDRVLDAADYGVPQHRERLFIIGLREGDFLFPRPTHGPDSPDHRPFYTAGAAIAGLDNDEGLTGIGGRFGALLNDIPAGLNYSFYTKEMGHPNPIFSWRSKFSDYLYKADPETPVRTLKAQVGAYSGPFHWSSRPFTVAELKRLQTFPDGYQLSGGRQACIQQIGNSVPPQLSRMLALAILDQIFGLNLPCSLQYLPHEMQLGFRQRKRQVTQRYMEKAKAALRERTPSEDISEATGHPGVTHQENVRFLCSNFGWFQSRTAHATELHLSKELGPEEWRIECTEPESPSLTQTYTLLVAPSVGGGWPLSQQRVRLEGTTWTPLAFTALWKSFEESVYGCYGIPDAVQLSGYYQYSAKIRAILSYNAPPPPLPLWSALPCIVQGTGVAGQYTASELAMLWHLEEDQILPLLKELRRIGYEVRNRNTNPQIQEGLYLLPYAFPTLTPKSVQLRKRI